MSVGVNDKSRMVFDGLPTRKSKKLLSLTALLAATALTSPVYAAGPALPTGGKVVAGSAIIGAPSGSALTVTQSSAKAILTWSGFSIGVGGAVRFDNGSGATLNRVTGTSLSSIDGLLSGTGSVYLINPNGVIIGKSGVVDVGGTFVASTLDATDANFLVGGDLKFIGSSPAAVVNYGKVGALGGDVALIAASVTNVGSVTAASGTAGLVSGYSVLLRDAALDDGKFSVLLGGAGTSVANGGLIAAADVELRAEGGNVYALAGDTAGVIRATGVKSGDGHVWLVADGGTLDVAGTIKAQGVNGTAGAIETSGQTVKIGQAAIDAHSGAWTLDPADLTIDQTAANTIAQTLDVGTNVVEQTSVNGTGGNGDIIFDPDVTVAWNTASSLTLSAYRNIDIGAGVVITSDAGPGVVAGAVTLAADNTGLGVGTVTFGAGASVSTSGPVNIFYNPASYTDAATKSTQSFNGSTATDTFANPYTSFVTGGATLNAYMLVNSLAQLQGVGAELDGLYALGRNIDASASATMNPISGGDFAGFQPLGGDPGYTPNAVEFSGRLDGQGYAVSGLYINLPSATSVGLIGAAGAGAVIANIGLTGGSITGGTFVGPLVGEATQYSAITNANASTPVAGASDVGGLAGYVDGNASNVYAKGAVTGVSQTGGLFGQLSGGVLTSGYATGAVTGTNAYTGGLIGEANGPGTTLANVYATGAVNGDTYVGGLVGNMSVVSLTNAYATGAVAGINDVGGLIGYAGAGPVTNAYATGSVTGLQDTDTTPYSAGSNVGGLVGLSEVNLTAVYATGSVTANASQVGGLVGDAGSSVISDAYATGAVTQTGSGASNVGGLVGLSYDQIDNSYASGAVVGVTDVGGLVGFNAGQQAFGPHNGASVTNSYETGSVTATGAGADVGGLVGFNAVMTNGSTTNGLVSGDYATGAVSGPAGAVIGGLIGENDGILSNSVWDRTTSGQSVAYGAGVGGSGTGTSINIISVQDTDLTASDYAFSTAPYIAAGFTFGATPGGSGTANWVIVDQNGTFNNAGSAAGGTRPFLLNEYATALTNAHQLQLVVLAPSASYSLGSDIAAGGTGAAASVAAPDMWSPAGFVPIGTGESSTQNNQFNGVLDGGGHAITGLYINSTEGNVGLISTDAGTIMNLHLVGGSVSGPGGDADVGDVVGFDSGGAITNVSETGNVSGTSNADVGGLVGFVVGGGAAMITGSSAAGAVSGDFDAGGLVGASGGPIVDSYATGAVSGPQRLGGLVGETFGANGTVTNSYATGMVSGTLGPVGGLIGLANAPVMSSYATGAVSGASEVGGLIGEAEQTVTASHASGTVNGGSEVGGLIGDISGAFGSTTNAVEVAGSSATGTVTGSGSAVGGLVGSDIGRPIIDSFGTGDVSGGSQTGGLVGVMVTLTCCGTTYTPSITGSTAGQTYASGSVTGSGTSTGGLVGENQGAITQASYVPTGAGVTGTADVGGLVGLNDANATLSIGAATGSVNGTSYTGGVIGDNFGAVTTASFTGSVSGAAGVGGIAGVNEGGASLSGVSVGQLGATPATSVTGTGDDVGGIAGASFGTIGIVGVATPTNIAGYSHVDGITVNGLDHVGGLVGSNFASLQADGDAQVTGNNYVGGAVGVNYGPVVATVQANNSAPTVKGANYVGGLIGWNDTAGTVSESDAGVQVIASGNYVGGLLGVNKGSVANSTAAAYDNDGSLGSVSGAGLVGGLVGLNQGLISQSNATIPVTGDLYVGGLVGWNDTGATITTSYSIGAVTGIAGGQEVGTNNDYVGGLVGVNFGSVANTYATGAVSGVQVVGGLVGTNMPGGASVSTSYSTGAVSASRGAVGTTFGVQAGEVSYVYGFPSLSGQPVENGYTNAGSTGGGTDLTPAQEDGSAAYVGFDFTNTWQSNPDGPPTLKPATPG